MRFWGFWERRIRLIYLRFFQMTTRGNLNINQFYDPKLREILHRENLEKAKLDKEYILKSVLLNFNINKELFRLLVTQTPQERIDLINELQNKATSHPTPPNMKRRINKKKLEYTWNPEIDLQNFLNKTTLIKKIFLANYNLNTVLSMRNAYSKAQLLQQWLWFPQLILTWYKIENGQIVIEHTSANIIKDWFEMFARWDLTNKNKLKIFFSTEFTKHQWDKSKKNKSRIAEAIIIAHKMRFYAWYVYFPEYGIDQPIKWKHEWIIDLQTLYEIFVKTDNQINANLARNILKEKQLIIPSVKPNKPLTDKEKEDIFIDNIIKNQILYDPSLPVGRKNIFDILAEKKEENQLALLGKIILLVQSLHNGSTDKAFIQDVKLLKSIVANYIFLKGQKARVMKEIFFRIKRTHNWEWVFWPVPFWYKIENWQIICDDKVAIIINQWLELYANGQITSESQLSKFFQEHIPREWSCPYQKLVSKIFSDDYRLIFYTWNIYNKSYGINIPIKWKHPPIISRETFYKIWEIRGTKPPAEIWLSNSIKLSENQLIFTNTRLEKIKNIQNQESLIVPNNENSRSDQINSQSLKRFNNHPVIDQQSFKEKEYWRKLIFQWDNYMNEKKYDKTLQSYQQAYNLLAGFCPRDYKRLKSRIKKVAYYLSHPKVKKELNKLVIRINDRVVLKPIDADFSNPEFDLWEYTLGFKTRKNSKKDINNKIFKTEDFEKEIGNDIENKDLEKDIEEIEPEYDFENVDISKANLEDMYPKQTIFEEDLIYEESLFEEWYI